MNAVIKPHSSAIQFTSFTYSRSLLRLFANLDFAGIKAIEWGTGLKRSMGAPVGVLCHIFVIPFEGYQDAQNRVLQSGLSTCTPEYNQYGHLGEMGQTCTIPDQRIGVRLATLILLDTQHVRINLDRLEFHPLYKILRPDPIETVTSYIYLVCHYHEDHRGNQRARGAILVWLTGFVLYTVCGVRSETKCEIEDEVYEDPAWEINGLEFIDGLPFTDDLRWLQTTLLSLVKGKFKYENFNPRWWDQNVVTAAPI